MIKRIYIEITNLCNLRCSFCRKSRKPPRSLSLQEFEQIIRQVREYTDYIYLHVQGEPLLHPAFSRIMDLCDASGMQVQLVTNGSLLNRFPDLLSHCSLRKLSVSLQSLAFQNTDIDSYMDTVLALCSTASKQKRPFMELRFWRDDQSEEPVIRKAFARIEEHCEFQPAGRKNSLSIMPGVYVTYANSFDWPDPDEPEQSDSGYCLGGIEQLAVLSDGTVVPCCLDCDGVIAFGNILQEPLSSILSGERYRKFAEGIMNRKLTEHLCRSCTFRTRFR
ncbi:MAG: SPASM domain-containing protein [Solobacterium sp.]|nr:SPASM domain-containing protein [Solobacterium sp.]